MSYRQESKRSPWCLLLLSLLLLWENHRVVQENPGLAFDAQQSAEKLLYKSTLMPKKPISSTRRSFRLLVFFLAAIKKERKKRFLAYHPLLLLLRLSLFLPLALCRVSRDHAHQKKRKKKCPCLFPSFLESGILFLSPYSLSAQRLLSFFIAESDGEKRFSLLFLAKNLDLPRLSSLCM